MLDLQRVVRDFSPAAAPLRLRFGVVQSFAGGLLVLRISGSTTDVSGIRYLESYVPTNGDTVALFTDGLDVLVIGSLA